MPSELIVVIVDVVALALVSSALVLLAKEEVVMEAVMLLVVIFPILTYNSKDINAHVIQDNSGDYIPSCRYHMYYIINPRRTAALH